MNKQTTSAQKGVLRPPILVGSGRNSNSFVAPSGLQQNNSKFIIKHRETYHNDVSRPSGRGFYDECLSKSHPKTHGVDRAKKVIRTLSQPTEGRVITPISFDEKLNRAGFTIRAIVARLPEHDKQARRNGLWLQWIMGNILEVQS